MKKEGEEKMQFSAACPRPHRLNYRPARRRQTSAAEIQTLELPVEDEVTEGEDSKDNFAPVAALSVVPILSAASGGIERAVELERRVGEMGARKFKLNLPAQPCGYSRRQPPPPRYRNKPTNRLEGQQDNSATSTIRDEYHPNEANLSDRCTRICLLKEQRPLRTRRAANSSCTTSVTITTTRQQDPLRPIEYVAPENSRSGTTSKETTTKATVTRSIEQSRHTTPDNVKLLIIFHLFLPLMLISTFQPLKHQIKSPILLVGAQTSESVNDWQHLPVVGDSRREEPSATNSAYKNNLDRLVKDDLIIVDQGQSQNSPIKPQRKRPLDFIKHQVRHSNSDPKHYHHNHHHHHHHHHPTPHLKPHDELHLKSEKAPLEPDYEHLKDGDRNAGSPNSIHSDAGSRRRRRHFDNFDSPTDRPVVATEKGLVRGITQKMKSGSVDAFLGIPYAEPPVGPERFRHPAEKQPWSGQLDASRLPNSCYQVNDTFFGANFLGTSIWNANTPLSEDCLYLNIWAPILAYKDQKSKAVLVWIFGGGFYSGTASLALYDGGTLASEEDIIVVSMNYRVSALGFLYLGKNDAPGNAGLFDQLMALRWINKNIAKFGGDPDRVTIFGESAGAVSAALHLLSPLSRDLFTRAILQSGAPTCPWGYKQPNEILANGLQLASLVNCPANETDLGAVIECLRKVDPMVLVSGSLDVGQTKTILKFPFVPVVDGVFLQYSPEELLKKSDFKNTSVLLGSNLDEGNSFLIYLPEFNKCPGSGDDNSSKLDKSSKQRTIANSNSNGNSNNNNNYDNYDMASTYSESQSVMMSELRDQGQLTGNVDSFPVKRQHLEQAAAIVMAEAESQRNPNLSDSKSCKPKESLSFSHDDFIELLREELNPYAINPIAKDSIVYEYSNWNNIYDQNSNHDALDKIVGDFYFTCHVNDFANRYAQAGNQVYMYYFKHRSSISPWPRWMGVIHGDEVNFVFGEPVKGQHNYTENEINFSRRMMNYWANFAKYGNPTKLSENSSREEIWPEYADKRQYFELHSESMKTGRGPRAKQCALWSHYLPTLNTAFGKKCPGTNLSVSSPFLPPMDPSSCRGGHKSCSPTGGSNTLLSNVPSSVIISLSVILVLSIIGLLFYAKKTGVGETSAR